MKQHSEYPPCSILYADLREKWMHEDRLINQRITWLLGSQGFLFPAFGVLAKLRLDIFPGLVVSGEIVEKSEFWLYGSCEAIVVVSGVVVMHYMRHGVLAAIRAMDEIKSQLESHRNADRIWGKVRVDVLDETSRAGTSPVRGMINTFALVWVCLLFYEVLRLASIADRSWATYKLAAAGVLLFLLLLYKIRGRRKIRGLRVPKSVLAENR